MGALDGKVALITGGARGQGRSHALALAEQGADIVVCDIAAPIATIDYPMGTTADLDETVRLVRQRGRRAKGLIADMRVTAEVQGVVAATLDEFGAIDILVANHGVLSFSTLEDMSDEMWETLLATNLTGVFKIIRAVIPTMKAAGYGRIIATSSMAARAGYPNLVHYVASKWAIVGFVKGCALELADCGITVNAVCPTSVGTEMILNDASYRRFCPELAAPTFEDFRRRLDENQQGLNGHPFLLPEHVSRAIVYLATDHDGILTGQAMQLGLELSMINTA